MKTNKGIDSGKEIKVRVESHSFVSPEYLAKALAMVAKTIKSIKDENADIYSAEFSKVENRINNLTEQVKRMVQSSETRSTKDLEALGSKVEKLIIDLNKKIKSELEKIQIPDMSPFVTRSEYEAKIAELMVEEEDDEEEEEEKEESAEEVRDKLESLEGDDRLDRSAIKGLDSIYAKTEDVDYAIKTLQNRTQLLNQLISGLREDWENSEGGGSSLQQLSFNPAPDGIETVFTLSETPTGATWIMLNGQKEQNTVNYSISGDQLTFVTAPDADDNVEVWTEISISDALTPTTGQYKVYVTVGKDDTASDYNTADYASDDLAIQAAATYAATNDLTLYIKDGTYTMMGGVILRQNTIFGPNCILSAGAAMTYIIAIGISSYVFDTTIEGNGCRIHCNDLADYGIYMARFEVLYVKNFTIQDALVHQIHCGDPTSHSYSGYISNINGIRENNTPASGSVGFYLESNCTDNLVYDSIFSGQDIGMDINSSDNRFNNIHLWTSPSKGWMTVGIDDHANRNFYNLISFDTPRYYGLYFRGNQVTVTNSRFFNSPTYGEDNVVIGVKMVEATSIASLIGNQFQGGDVTHRIAKAVDAASTNNLKFLGNQQLNVVTQQDDVIKTSTEFGGSGSQTHFGIGTLTPSDPLNVVGAISSGTATSVQGHLYLYGTTGNPLVSFDGFLDDGRESTIQTSSNNDKQLQIKNTGTGKFGLYVEGNTGINLYKPSNTFSVSPLFYSTGTASQSGTTVTGSGTTFTASMIGMIFSFDDSTTDDPTSTGIITAVASATSLTLSVSQTVSSRTYSIHYAGLQTTSAGLVGIGTTSPTAILTVQENTDAASVQGLLLKGSRKTPANNDEIYQSFNLNNSAGTTKEFGRITVLATDVTSTSEDASFTIGTMQNGTVTNYIRIGNASIRPVSNDLASLGVATSSFSDLFLASGGVINFNNGNYTLTHSTGILTTSGTFVNGGVNRLKSYTVATLPAGTQGDTAYVTDATAPTYLGALTGGGAVVCPVFYNGSAWVSA